MFSLARMPLSFIGMTAGQTPFGAGAGALGGALSLASGFEELSRGRTMPGLLNLGAGAGGLLRAAPTFAKLAPEAAQALGLTSSAASALGTAGKWTGGLTSLAGLGYGLAQGTQAGDRMAFDSAMNLMAVAYPPLGIPAFVGKAVETIVNAGLGEGAFGKTPLPFGRGNRFSSADNLASQLSKFISLQGENAVLDFVQKAEDPVKLLALALGGAKLAPHGEIQFSHPVFGFGGDWRTPASPSWERVIRDIVARDDADLLRQFIAGVQVRSGETGIAEPNYLLTDWYRRKLVSLLPESSPLRKNMDGLFEPLPENEKPGARLEAYLQAAKQQMDQGVPGYTPEKILQDLLTGSGAGTGDYPPGHRRISLLFRQPSELVDENAARKRMAEVFGWPETRVTPPPLPPGVVMPPPARRSMAEPWVDQGNGTFENRVTGEVVSATPPASAQPVYVRLQLGEPWVNQGNGTYENRQTGEIISEWVPEGAVGPAQSAAPTAESLARGDAP